MNWKKYLPIVGVSLLIYLLYKAGLNNILQSIKEVKIIYLVLSLVASVLLLFLFAIKWGILLKGQKTKISKKEMYKIFLLGWVYGILTPGRIGSFLRINFLKEKTGKSLGFCSSSVILDRIFDTIGLFFMAFLGSLLLIKEYSNLYIIMIIFIIALIFGVFIILNKKLINFLIQKAHKIFIPKKLHSKTKEIFEEFYDNLPNKKSMVYSFILNLITWFLAYAIGYILVLALGLNIPFIKFAPLSSIAGVISLLPITISGLGTREATYLVLFGSFGATAAQLISLSLLTTIINMYLPAIIILTLIRK